MVKMTTRAILAVVLIMLVSAPVLGLGEDAEPLLPNTAVSDTIDSLRKKIEAEGKAKSTDDPRTNRDLKELAAESARRAEQAFQADLQAIEASVKGIETRVAGYRRLVVPPTKSEIERLNQDLEATERALKRLAVPSQSPLCQIQWVETQDRLFELQLAVAIMSRRWGDGWRIFGADFFGNVSATDTPEPPTVPDTYTVRIGDKLEVDVLSSVGERSRYPGTVDAFGYVSVPGIGKIRAAGRTVKQLRGEVTSKLSAKFKQLKADVAVIRTQPVRVQVTGEVAKPSSYSLSGTATVFAALCQAGGPTKSGSYRKVTLVRTGESRKTVDLYGFLMHGDKSADIALQEGDLIFVPPVGGTITIEGEVVRPARYEPDFPMTLATALKMAGGTSPGGYLHSVQVERIVGGEYRVLLDTPSAQDGAKAGFAIQPGDQITVRPLRPDKTSQVSVTGPVGAPGLYGFSQGMKVSDLIKSAQGLAHDREIYGARADILRMDPLKGTELVTFDLDKALNGDPQHNIELQKLDRVYLYQPEQVIYRPRLIGVKGAVAKEGTYRRAEGMHISDAVAAAGGVSVDAYLTRADLIRHKADGTTELIRVDLEKALTRIPSEDVRLQDRDVLNIYTISQAQWQDRTVRVEGAVQRPGSYVRSEGMRVSDLLLASGGLLPEAATSAEIGRWTGKGESQIISVDLAAMDSRDNRDVVLRDRDVLTIPEVNPALRSPEVVYLHGEVARPGPYTLRKDEKLVDLIEKAGGLTSWADKRGLMFLRQKSTLENSQQSSDVDIILQKSRAFASKQFVTGVAKMGMTLPQQYLDFLQISTEKLARPAETTGDAQTANNPSAASSASAAANPSNGPGLVERTKDELTPREIESATALGPRIPDDSETEAFSLTTFLGRKDLAGTARISIDLERAFRDVNSPDNIPLRAGDHVSIPKITNVVTVLGAVLHPHAFAAGPGRSVDYYIERSGGFAQDAAKGSVVVVRSNGDALPRSRTRTAEPGDIIVVPTTGIIDIAKKWERISPVTKALTDVLSSVYILTRF